MNQATMQASSPVRLASIDILRGLVMLIMLLDHVRERFFYQHVLTDPMTLSETETSLFFTRILAHLCAPIFVFLTGISAYLYANPVGRPPRPVAGFLLKRGLFLILLEVTVINFSWFGTYHALYLQVIWAIGVSMLMLALLSYLPRSILAVLAVVIIAGHNALEYIQFNPDEWAYTIWAILHDRNTIFDNGSFVIKASYPVLPWIGIILLGYVIAPLFSRKISPSLRRKWLIGSSLIALLTLLVLRGLNTYGETLWQPGEDSLHTLMSMLNFTKYPPSLHFVLATIGIGLGLLAVFEGMDNRFSRILQTFGSVPMFFYILHLYLLLIGYKLTLAIVGPNAGELYGFGALWQVWALMTVLAFVLYLPCQYFAQYKRQSNSWWIKYL